MASIISLASVFSVGRFGAGSVLGISRLGYTVNPELKIITVTVRLMTVVSARELD